MNRLVLKYVSGRTEQTGGDQSQLSVQMRAEDENVLCYVSGYISLKLMRRFEKQSGAKARQFVECLSKMAVMGKESSFYEYVTAYGKTRHMGLQRVSIPFEHCTMRKAWRDPVPVFRLGARAKFATCMLHACSTLGLRSLALLLSLTASFSFSRRIEKALICHLWSPGNLTTVVVIPPVPTAMEAYAIPIHQCHHHVVKGIH